jgi:hypothetical protein
MGIQGCSADARPNEKGENAGLDRCNVMRSRFSREHMKFERRTNSSSENSVLAASQLRTIGSKMAADWATVDDRP